jgi:uncharacterized protein (UPF0335 family)
MINRMNTYKLDDNTKRHEVQVIEQIARDNGFDTSVVHDINKQKQKRDGKENKEKWARFTYLGKEVVFRRTININ